MLNTILAVVANYRLENNARLLRVLLAPHLETIIVNSASENMFIESDISIPNTGYPGLWNQAVQTALYPNKERLFFLVLYVVLKGKCCSNDWCVCLWNVGMSLNG